MFQRCYLGDSKTETFFTNLINDVETDYTRYICFYVSFLIENNRIEDAKKLTKDIDYINSSYYISRKKLDRKKKL